MTSDANASPMMTAFTTMSALENIPQGERSCGSSARTAAGSPDDVSRTIPIAALCVLLAFVLTRRALTRSSHPYRIPAKPFGMAAWGTGR